MAFDHSIKRFRELAESRALAEAQLPIGGKLVKKSQIVMPDNPAHDPSKHLARSVPKAANKLKAMRKG